MAEKAFIAGCKTTTLSHEEIDFFKCQNPWGYILFQRNLHDRDQARALVDHLRECSGRENIPILIDEEGGRVQRMKPPTWQSYPPGRFFGRVYEKDQEAGLRTAWLVARLIAHDLKEIGINTNCVPVLDVLTPQTSNAIGDRAYSDDPEIVTNLAKQVAEGTQAGGVACVLKHMPGHGRANCDSHYELPRVDAEHSLLQACDFLPFKKLNQTSMAMTAHIIFDAIDADIPATLSPKVIDQVIRGEIGFSGLLMSDDVSMQALSGDYFSRAKSIFEAGCDIVLHCNGDMEEMKGVAEASPMLSGESAIRADAALTNIKPPKTADITELRNELQEIIVRFDECMNKVA